MQDYEAVCVLKATLTEERANALFSRFEKKITDSNGESVRIEKMGQRRLPFRMKKHKNEQEGLYVLIKFKGDGSVAEVLRNDFRIQEDVLRFLITRIPENEQVLAEEAEIAAPTEEISGQSQ